MEKPLSDNLPTVLKNADVTQAEFAELCGVRRVTVNLWCRGKMRPHRYIRSNVLSLVERVEHATSAGVLPLPRSVKRGDRLDALRQATTN